MSTFRTSLSIAALAGGLFFSALAQAHPKLISSDPQANAETVSPTKIELHFSETLVTQFSGAKLVMTGMPGMTHSPMSVDANVSGGTDGKTMIITPAKPLVTGTYRVEWRAVSSDTHPVTGSLSFSVK
ncbi:copper homeostasis periplasmic binding protein CopC [Bordetella tumulicola]|uniref:copper homeostasis periplasmic binding protein CopC n=1 Tax=Bordetella tumulicola TaxID=1649133 RepID=UPI0039EF7764